MGAAGLPRPRRARRFSEQPCGMFSLDSSAVAPPGALACFPGGFHPPSHLFPFGMRCPGVTCRGCSISTPLSPRIHPHSPWQREILLTPLFALAPLVERFPSAIALGSPITFFFSQFLRQLVRSDANVEPSCTLCAWGQV